LELGKALGASSPQRYSIATLRPSGPAQLTQSLDKGGGPLALCRRRTRASNLMVTTFHPDSARAASGHAAAAPASSVMNSRLSIDRIAFDPRRAGLQNIELARISQDVRERFYNLLAIGETGHCPATGRLKRESPDGFGSGLPRGHSPAPHAGQRHLPRKLDYRLTAPGLHHEREAALLQLLVSLEP